MKKRAFGFGYFKFLASFELSAIGFDENVLPAFRHEWRGNDEVRSALQ